ncbi:MAG: hypothetical protein RLZZ223_338 [Candidatus Parcubacteria bacterium]|jgi:hypothetical protein
MDSYLLPNEETLRGIAGNFLCEAGQQPILIEYAGLTFSQDDLRKKLYNAFSFFTNDDFDRFFQAIIQESTPIQA